MLKRIILFFLIFYFSIQLKGQQPIPIIRGIDFPTDFILPNGKLVFTLPEGDQVVDKYPKEGTLNQITLGEHPLQVFSEGKAVVQRLDRSIYWINSKGIKVKEFGKRYSKMSAPIGGYCMAWEPIEGRRGENMMVFLDKNGVNAFGKQQFWEAAPFQEGLAAVQVEKNGTWGFIDATGKIALQPVNIAPEQIQRLYNFSEGLAKVEIKKSSRETNYVYINKKGEVILDLKKLYPDKKISSAAHFQEGHVAVSFSNSINYYYDVVFLNRMGKEAISLKSVTSFSNLKNGIICFAKANDQEETSSHSAYFIADTTGNQSPLTWPEGYSILELVQYNGNIELQIEKDSFSNYFGLFQPRPLKEIFLSKKNIVAHNGQNILLKDVILDNFELRGIDGRLLWETPPKDRIYQDIHSALPYKNVVRYYELRQPEDFNNGLFSFKNLESLNINWCNLTKLPKEIANFKKLRRLDVQLMDHLQGLPEDIAYLPKLESLSISDCKSFKDIKTLERIIEKCTSLKYVYLNDIPLNSTFIEKMKQQRPELTINSWSSFSDFEIGKPNE